MSGEKKGKGTEWHYITAGTAEQAMKIKRKLHLQPGQTARIEPVGPDEFEILITNN